MAHGKATPEALPGLAGADQADAFSIENEVYRMWQEAQREDGTDPYSILRVAPDAPTDTIREVFNARLEKYGQEQRGANRVLSERLVRAATLLLDSAKREAFHAQRSAQCQDGTWMMLQYPNGRYEGMVRELPSSTVPKRHGHGINVLDGGERYEGNYREDRRQGLGLCIWAVGDVYVGQWNDDTPHGMGVYCYGSGPVYDGLFEGGGRHGHGRLRWHGGSSFKGEFVKDVRCGKGVEILMGRKGVRAHYSGEWKDNQKHGDGVYKAEGGLHYEGQFEGDNFHGIGHWQLPNGDEYQGPFFYGQPHVVHGAAIYRWGSTGDTYEGEIKRGRLHGKGEFMGAGAAALSLTYNGEWENDAPHGSGKVHVSTAGGDGVYDGQWVRGLKDGEGVYRWPDAEIAGSEGDCTYTGQFANDLRQGQGQIDWPDGSRWVGRVTEDVRHGEAVHCGPKAASVKEKWHFGVLCEREGKPVKTVDPKINDATDHSYPDPKSSRRPSKA